MATLRLKPLPPIKVLFILDSLVAGGAERSTVALMPALIERGITPEVAVLHDRPGLHDDLRALGIPIHDLSGGGGRLPWIRRLRSLISERSPDLVHTSLYEADVCGRIAARSVGVPVVSTLATVRYGENHFDVPGLSRGKVRLAQLTDAATARLTTQVHAVSDHVAEEMARNLRYPRDRIVSIPRGRPVPEPPSEADVAGVRADLGFGDRQIVLAVARHEWVKGLDRLLDAVPELIAARPDAVVLIAGRDGDQTAMLEALIRDNDLQDHVRLLGHREDVTLLMCAADVLVLTSRREGLPGVVIEAMAARCPIVANDIPQVREVVGPDEAIIVDASDPEALAHGLIETINDQANAIERADRAEQRFRSTFTLDRVAQAMITFYRRSLNQRLRRPPRSVPDNRR